MIRMRYVPKLLTILLALVILSGLFSLFKAPTDDRVPRVVASPTSNPVNVDLLRKVLDMNSRANLLNMQQFDRLTNDDLVLVVQVHRRIEYLKHLISSMAQVKHIERTLIVFSHDFYDDQINQLIAGIRFAKVSQMFYPFSIQIWTGTFPGNSPNDCGRDMSKSEALASGCSNAAHPDSYGHYREASVTQIKHHWWWKLHQVMDHLQWTRQHRGDFLFIEEDHYLIPDFVHVWRLMKAARDRSKSADLLTMGHYVRSVPDPGNAMTLNHTEWLSSKHNMAFTMDRVLWRRIKRCQSEFCQYDDYNWDWSLQHVIRKCLKGQLATLVPAFSRVYHLGNCGMHHKGINCNKQFEKLQEILATNKQLLFPDKMRIHHAKSGKKQARQINFGGWKDPRDQKLCSQYQLPFEQIIGNHPDLRPFQSLVTSS